VRCEDGSGPDLFEGLVEFHPGGHSLPDALKEGEGWVPLVKVKNGVLYPQRVKHLRAADAQDDFLPQPLLGIAYVEPGGYLPVPRVV
jgi:hypothetical protein